jgi:hypothetical protein
LLRDPPEPVFEHWTENMWAAGFSRRRRGRRRVTATAQARTQASRRGDSHHPRETLEHGFLLSSCGVHAPHGTRQQAFSKNDARVPRRVRRS